VAAHMEPRAKRSRRLPLARRERVAAAGGRVRGAEGLARPARFWLVRQVGARRAAPGVDGHPAALPLTTGVREPAAAARDGESGGEVRTGVRAVASMAA